MQRRRNAVAKLLGSHMVHQGVKWSVAADAADFNSKVIRSRRKDVGRDPAQVPNPAGVEPANIHFELR